MGLNSIAGKQLHLPEIPHFWLKSPALFNLNQSYCFCGGLPCPS